MQVLSLTLSGLLLVAALGLAVPVAVIVVQVMAAFAVCRPQVTAQAGGEDSSPEPGAIAVLMPAHDEAAGIAAAIVAVRRELRDGDRLLVVADNCTDDTAALARAAGAEVVERADGVRRGKGYALDFGVRYLATSPPVVVVIVDADCIVNPGALRQLARQCVANGRPAQALYLMRSPPGALLKTRIAEFAWCVKNEVRALGFDRLGLPCQLMGSGMAFPWPVLAGARLASGHIVEDLELGLELATSGMPPAFCPGALVTSVFPVSAAALAQQRTRWEHGHLAVIAGAVPRLLGLALTKRRPLLAAMAIDVCVPPLAALVLMLSLLIAVSSVLFLVAGSGAAALAVAAMSIAALLAALMLAWHGFGRSIVTLAELASAPTYAIGKIPMYLKAARNRQTEWIRTKRDDPGR